MPTRIPTASPSLLPTSSSPTVIGAPTNTCDLLSQFGVLRSEPYVSDPGATYKRAHVSEEGPTLSLNEYTVKVKASGQIDQFSFLTLDGVGAWYLDLESCMTAETLNQANPGFTLSGCAIPGIDGDYWINKVGSGDEVWVMKDGSYAIYFSPDSNPNSPDFCLNPSTTSTSTTESTTTTTSTTSSTTTPATITTSTTTPTTPTTTTSASTTTTTSTMTPTTTSPALTTTERTTTITSTSTGTITATSTSTTNPPACDYLSAFSLPQASPFNSGGNRRYDFVHVSPGAKSAAAGLLLSNVDYHIINCDSTEYYNGVHQFSFQTTAGSPDWFVDLLHSCLVSTEGFHEAQPDFELVGCGIDGLDGEYYIGGTPGTTEVWVEKGNGYAIVLSNSAAVPSEFC